MKQFTLDTTPLIKRLLNTKKKHFVLNLIEVDNIELNTSSYFDGGSKTCYYTINATTGKIEHDCPTGVYPKFEAKYTLPQGKFLVESGLFIGRPSTVRITVYYSDLDKFSSMFNIKIPTE